MHVLTVCYGHPADPAAFDSYYASTHRPLAEKIPGLLSFTARHCDSLDGTRRRSRLTHHDRSSVLVVTATKTDERCFGRRLTNPGSLTRKLRLPLCPSPATDFLFFVRR